MTRKVVAVVILLIAFAVWSGGLYAFATGASVWGAALTISGGLLMLRLTAAYQRTGAGRQSGDAGIWSAIRDSFPGFWP